MFGAARRPLTIRARRRPDCTTDDNCSSENPPSNATDAIAGNDSNARAVSTLSSTVRADSPCEPDRAVDSAALVEHPQHRHLTVRKLRCSHDQPLATASQPLRRMGTQLVDQHVEHAPIQPQGYDTYRPIQRVILRAVDASQIRQSCRAHEVLALAKAGRSGEARAIGVRRGPYPPAWAAHSGAVCESRQALRSDCSRSIASTASGPSRARRGRLGRTRGCHVSGCATNPRLSTQYPT